MLNTSRRIILALFGLVSRILYGQSNKHHTPKRIVIFQMAKLGDAVCTTPLFRAIKTSFPETYVSVVGSAVNKDMLEGNPDINRYHTFTGILSTLKEIRDEKYDTGILAGPDLTALSILCMAGIPRIVAPGLEPGVTPLADVWYRTLARFVETVPYKEGSYMPLQYLSLLKPLGITSTDTTKHLVYSATADAYAKEIILSTGLRQLVVGIAAGAGNKVKQWPPERFAEVADYLIESHGAKIILFGSERDAEATDEVMYSMQYADSVLRLDTINLDCLKAIVSNLSMVIASDTQIIYVAEAFGVPTIDIVGPVHPDVQPPRSRIHRVVTPSISYTPQITVLNAKWYDTQEVDRLAKATPVSAVIAEIDDLLASL